MNKESGWGSMHPDQEPPCFFEMRCKANPKVNAGGDPRPLFFRYLDATIQVRVVAIYFKQRNMEYCTEHGVQVR